MSSVPFSAGSPPGSTTINVPAGNPVAPPAVNPSIQIYPVNAVTETLIALPSNMVRFLLKMKDGTRQSNLRLSFTAGDTFFTNFIEFTPTSIYSEVDIQRTTGLNIYVRSGNMPLSVEVLFWTT